MTLRPVISSRQVPSKRPSDAPWFRLVLKCGHVTYRKKLRPTAGCVVCGRMALHAATKVSKPVNQLN
jgi:hypothetical protein